MTHLCRQNNFTDEPSTEFYEHDYSGMSTSNLTRPGESSRVLVDRQWRRSKAWKNRGKSDFASAIAESYFIPGITGRARCLNDTTKSPSDRNSKKKPSKHSSKSQRRAHLKSSASISSFASTNSWDIQRHSSGSWCPEDSRSIWADSFNVCQSLMVELETQPTFREKSSPRMTELNCSQTSLDDHFELFNPPLNYDKEDNSSSVFCHQQLVEGTPNQVSTGPSAISEKIESLQHELDNVCVLLRMQKDRKSFLRKTIQSKRTLPALKNSSSRSLFSPPTRTQSALSVWSLSSNQTACQSSPPLLTASPHRAKVSSRSLTFCTRTRRQKQSKRCACTSNDIDSASPLSGVQAVTLRKN